jgi:hypothetical protein
VNPVKGGRWLACDGSLKNATTPTVKNRFQLRTNLILC